VASVERVMNHWSVSGSGFSSMAATRPESRITPSATVAEFAATFGLGEAFEEQTIQDTGTPQKRARSEIGNPGQIVGNGYENRPASPPELPTVFDSFRQRLRKPREYFCRQIPTVFVSKRVISCRETQGR